MNCNHRDTKDVLMPVRSVELVHMEDNKLLRLICLVGNLKLNIKLVLGQEEIQEHQNWL